MQIPAPKEMIIMRIINTDLISKREVKRANIALKLNQHSTTHPSIQLQAHAVGPPKRDKILIAPP
jgi:hypothetical protein